MKMRKTGVLTFVLITVLSALGCGAESMKQINNATTITAQKPAAQTAITESELAVTDNNAGAPSSKAGNVMARADEKSLSVGRAVERVIDNTSLSQAQTSLTDTAPSDRKIIRNADLSLEAESPEDAQRRITTIAESNGGFVADSQQTSSDVRATKRDLVTMSVRVPSQKFAVTLDQIRQTSERVIFETVKGDDVTEEFIDIEARLKAKKALELQIVEIMKRANSVNEALVVERELAGVRGEIEKIEGRKRFLENQASLSTIKIKLQTPEVFSVSSAGFGHRFSEAFNSGFDVAQDFILGLVTLLVGGLPFAMIIGLPLVLVMRYLYKRHSRSRTIIELAEDELKTT